MDTDLNKMPNPDFEPRRDRVNVEVGALVQKGEVIYRILEVHDFETAAGVDLATGRSAPLRIQELRSVSVRETNPAREIDLDAAPEKDLAIAEDRYSKIQPLLARSTIGRHDIELRSAEVKVAPATLYRWINRYKATNLLTSLLPMQRGWKQGNGRIDPQSERVIHEVINEYYLTTQRPVGQKAIQEVQRRCHERNLPVPGEGAIRLRLGRISEKAILRGRGFKEKAKNKFLPAAGSFPNATYPLAVVQIDHTPADIILVDDVYRRPIGRPWISLAMDVYSRMVTGYYLSFDPPSEASVAMCVAHSALPKNDWLILHQVEAEWPVWGMPKTIYVDNGADFRSDNFRRSCLMYGINLEFRPVKQPRYGGHIERMLGTLLREIHALPGATFSSIKDREGYDSESHAAMTKSEFESWLVSLICNVYHKQVHSGIQMPPRRKWEIGIFGNAEVTGVGLPPRPADRLSVLLDFLPSFRRTVQTFGVTIDGLTYYAECLRPWINYSDPESKEKKDFIFRRDPRDVSSIWFFDPSIKQYFKVPLADQAIPAMSIWEYKQVKEKLRKDGAQAANKMEILRTLGELRMRVEASKEKTKKARRQAQRRREHEKLVTPAAPIPVAQDARPMKVVELVDLVDGDVVDFGDIA